ncbi:MOSC domain-containing protein [Megamonas hypermegale]|uniref:MOSC domain-containing protein n=1 Tax=Megamonas hypermegale TaxID=158847 RepID=UPI001D3CFFF5|nr:MOSC domain-containing protein [Megamonas hypermegale]MBM6834139.1 MOSC domain-containing protein [Megamonas hypermegale]
MGKILAVCISEKKGTLKKAIPVGEMIKDFGLKNDAHAGKWHRQISLLSVEAVRQFSNKYDMKVPAGAFGENLLVEGIDLKHLPVGTKLKCNDILLEITQIGKKCHLGCNIQKQTGECIMPNEGVFAIVLNGGIIKANDVITIEGD